MIPMDKALYVREMFASIAPRYDAMNRLLTGGVDERWRRRAIRELALGPKAQVIDLCCGTGDISLQLCRRDPTTEVIGVDFCTPMLTLARQRANGSRSGGNLRFLEADVMELPFPSEHFDGAIMAFSLRNIVDIPGTLREARRVLKPGRRFVNLDVTKAKNPFIRSAFNLYFFRLVPLLGRLFGGSAMAYQYLPNSLTNYPDAAALSRLFVEAGFVEVHHVPLAGGTIALHIGAAP